MLESVSSVDRTMRPWLHSRSAVEDDRRPHRNAVHTSPRVGSRFAAYQAILVQLSDSTESGRVRSCLSVLQH